MFYLQQFTSKEHERNVYLSILPENTYLRTVSGYLDWQFLCITQHKIYPLSGLTNS